MTSNIDDLEEGLAVEEDLEVEESLNYAQNLEKFKQKMALVPKEYHEVLGWLYVYRQIQDQRMRLINRATQFKQGKRVFWAHVLPPEMALPMMAQIRAAAENIVQAEEVAAERITRLLIHTSWYQDVAVPAARGIGISKNAGAVTAARFLDAYASPSRFKSFGAFVRYSRLAPENGRAPKYARGRKIHFSPKAWQALYNLSECWNRLPDCEWRVLWDAWKAIYAKQHPDYPKGRIHNMARRKILRAFLRDLWDLWNIWEQDRSVSVAEPVGCMSPLANAALPLGG